MPEKMTEKIVGILGGMGPEATIDLMSRIMRLTPAADDIDHIRCIVDNNPKVPSRIKAIIEGTGESPVACMADMAKNLEACGADFLVIPCNTAHYYHRDVQAAVGVPVLNLIKLTIDTVLAAFPEVKKIGLLASPAVRITGLYENVLGPMGLEVIYPKRADEERLFSVIRDVKAGAVGNKTREILREIVDGVRMDGAELGIIACTELSVVNDICFSLPIFDAADVLANEIVAIVKKGKKLRQRDV